MRLERPAARIPRGIHTIETLARQVYELWQCLEAEVEDINRKIESDDVDILIECQEMIPKAEWEAFQHREHMRQIHARRHRHNEASRSGE